MQVIVQMIMIFYAILLVGVDIDRYVRKKISEKLMIFWCLFGVLLLLFSVVPQWNGWSKMIAEGNGVAILVMFMFCVLCTYGSSMEISKMKRKNQELAMQVSLLNQENEMIISKLREIIKEDTEDEKCKKNY